MRRLFGGVYSDRRVLVTGHTGFKGSWLALWLTNLGAQVTAISLPPPTRPNHFDLLTLNVDSRIQDITDESATLAVFSDAQPHVVFHLAAQPLVLRSYQEPVETFRTNLLGVVSVLEACRKTASVQAVVVVTSDKCYENREWPWPYRENDTLGGSDPYSASKAAAEIVARSYLRSFFEGAGRVKLATARAGNVIGGGDWAADRLVPDLIRAGTAGRALRIRCPKAVRPWQHVLESLSGYLLLGQNLLASGSNAYSAWNFGPDAEACRTVEEVVREAARHWPAIQHTTDDVHHPPEAQVLRLDASLARNTLHWTPIWDWRTAVAATVRWYRAYAEGNVLSCEQLTDYCRAADRAGAVWCKS